MAKTEAPEASSELSLLKQPRRRDIDGLRGVAVLAVLGYHFIPEAVHSGLLGVDVFFVISGFVITNLLVREMGQGTFRILHFWMFRIRRLFPALIAVLVTALVAGWFLLWPVDYQHLGTQVIWAAFFMGNIGQWRNSSYFDGDLVDKPLAHLWSLGVEEQFYLAWPLLLLLLVAVITMRRMLPAILVLIGLSWITCVLVGRSNPSAAFFLPWFRAWELLMGAAVAVIVANRADVVSRVGRRAGPLAIAALVALIVVFFLPLTSDNPGRYALATVALTAAVIGLGGHGGWPERLLVPRWLLLFGAISYPLYLWHWVVLSFGLRAGVERGGVLASAVMAAVAIGAAYATYRFLEAPFRRRTPSRIMMVSLLGGMVAVAMAAALIVVAGGFPGRLSGIQKSLSEYTYDYQTAYRTGTCFITDGGSLAPQCLDPDATGTRILIWGDSHAADLYPGLAMSIPSDMSLLQATASACAPNLPDPSTQTETCARVNEQALQYIRATRPPYVLISANWGAQSPEQLTALLKELDTVEGTTPIVVGPTPIWVAPLPQALADSLPPGASTIPRYSATLVDPGYPAQNQSVKETTASAGSAYLDARSLLCTSDGCLTYVGDDPMNLTAWDEAHLTTAGSTIIARALLDGGLLSSRGSG